VKVKVSGLSLFAIRIMIARAARTSAIIVFISFLRLIKRIESDNGENEDEDEY
jgi:hypothetical protein